MRAVESRASARTHVYTGVNEPWVWLVLGIWPGHCAGALFGRAAALP